jgi:hypothetical protein
MENNPSREREIVFCHQCENEWYRDEHGIICPECHGEFVEIVEAGHDPRQEDDDLPDLVPYDAPDPDEDDIDNLRLEQTGPETYRLRGTYRTTLGGQQGQQQDQQGQAGGLMGLVGNLLQGMVGAQGQQQRQQQEGPNSPGRPASAPGSPPPNEQQRGGNGTWIRSGQGPGFSYTIATSSNRNFGGGQLGGMGGMGGPDLFPRNANGPQPFQNQPDHIEQMLNQMMMNIGAAPGGMRGMRMGGPDGPPHPFHNHNHDPFAGGPNGPFIIAGGPGMPATFASLLNMFGPPGGMAGDAVYSQEALDRIITQLMEQHQAGNAPGPASEAAIKALPRRPITTADQGESGKAECSICMDEIPLGENVTELPCHHWFHYECIKAWLGEHDTCPHCRQGITPAEGEGQAPRSPSQAPLHDMRSPEYTRPAGVPGAYPFPRQESFGQGPPGQEERRRNSEGDRRGVFGRMRDAFSGGSSSGQSKREGGGSRDGGSGNGGGGASGS